MTTSPERERPPVEPEGSEDEGPVDTRDGATLPSGESSRLDSASMLNAALRYASLGWHVFPCVPGGKAPLAKWVPHGHLDATTDPVAIEAWWRFTPDANIGVALKPSGLAVLDVDPRNGGDVSALMAACDLGSPLVASTGGGGTHFVYGDRGVELRSSLGYAGLDGIDVKRDGYIIVAPSVTTGPYTWADSMVLDGYYETDGGEHLRVEHVELMCSMVLDLCRAPSKAARELAAMRTEALNDREAAYIDAALNDACQRLASTSEGYRHAAVYYTARALGEYVGGGVLERGRARARITQAAEALYGEGLWNVEVKTIEQGLDKGAREPRGIPDEYDGARRLLARIAEADDPMSIVELYGENNPELLRDFGAPDLDGELKVALKNAYHVGGGLALARFTHLVVTS